MGRSEEVYVGLLGIKFECKVYQRRHIFTGIYLFQVKIRIAV